MAAKKASKKVSKINKLRSIALNSGRLTVKELARRTKYPEYMVKNALYWLRKRGEIFFSLEGNHVTFIGLI